MSVHVAWFAVCITVAMLFAAIIVIHEQHKQFRRCMRFPTAGRDFCTVVIMGEP